MRENTKHTPGPWRTKFCGDGIYAELACVVTTGAGLEIVGPRQLGYPTVPASQIEANASLIAAAPELLEACLAAVKYHGLIYGRAESGDFAKLAHGGTTTGEDLDAAYMDWLQKSQNAIAKATGGAS